MKKSASLKNQPRFSRDFARRSEKSKQENPLFTWINTAQQENYARLVGIARRFTPLGCNPQDLVHEIALAWPASALCENEGKLLAYFTTCCRNNGYKFARKHQRRAELDAMVVKTVGGGESAFDGEPIPAVQMAEQIFRDARDAGELRDGLTVIIEDLFETRPTRAAHLAKFLGRFRDAADLQATLTRTVAQVPTARRLGVSQSLYSKYVQQVTRELAPAASQELLR